MILDESSTIDRPEGDGVHKPLPSRPEDEPPAYSRAPTALRSSPSRTLSLSRNRQAVAPFSLPVNALNMCTKKELIRGSWSLDPLATQLPSQNLVQMFLDGAAGQKRRRFRSPKGLPPTAKFSSRHGGIQATLRVIGDSSVRTTATIRSETRSGNTVLELVSIAPMRTVHIDARSRQGSVTLLIPRSFCGLVELSSRNGGVEVLPVLAASGRVIKTKDRETTVLIGDGPMPQVGLENVIDTARLHSRHGRVRLGFSGEDYFTEPPKLIEQAVQLMQKLIMPSSQKF
ncbi:hypothetical protein B0F90DRAFT_1695818 [Multifurca ochricompacta]|uniref:DUF7330 domain-containing protein n=1 Tax=Multifurca ochricompacta TaxID=376703 RepID=A0AAD4M926_9AGAM|nr:hypothetical protein B0F90DRAFT_1695818 [Multifurca ochricompacta]